MKAYIYINEDALVYLYGILNNRGDFDLESGDIRIMYATQPIGSMDLQVSLTADQFIYLKDLEVLNKYELINN